MNDPPCVYVIANKGEFVQPSLQERHFAEYLSTERAWPASSRSTGFQIHNPLNMNEIQNM